MKKPDIISNLVYSLERKIGWCPKPPTTKSKGAIYHKDYGQKLRWGKLHIFGITNTKTIRLTLFLMLVLMGTPTLINILFFNPPNLFPFYSSEIVPVEVSDHTTTVEKGRFSSQFETFTTGVEVKTKPFNLDASQIVEVDYYWLSMDKNGFPFGDYYAGLEYGEENSNKTVDEMGYSIRLIYSEGVSQIRDNEHEYRFPSPAPAFGIHGFQLPKAFQNEYVFKLVAYTNATVKPDESIARFVLVYKYKSSITIMGYRINLETIGYTALLLPFALLAIALMFQIMKREHDRLPGSTNLVTERLSSEITGTK
jgi:hypothetical protein